MIVATIGIHAQTEVITSAVLHPLNESPPRCPQPAFYRWMRATERFVRLGCTAVSTRGIQSCSGGMSVENYGIAVRIQSTAQRKIFRCDQVSSGSISFNAVIIAPLKV